MAINTRPLKLAKTTSGTGISTLVVDDSPFMLEQSEGEALDGRGGIVPAASARLAAQMARARAAVCAVAVPERKQCKR